MTRSAIPDELRRFLLTGALSVSHVEAIIQLRGDKAQAWDAQRLSARLYIRPNSAAKLLDDLRAIGIAQALGTDAYTYSPGTPELASLLDQLHDVYSSHLVEVAKLIHSVEQRKALSFADAFVFRKEFK